MPSVTFKSQENFVNSFLGSFAYRSIVERNKNHFLVQARQRIDLSELDEKFEQYYSLKGRKGYTPSMLVKILFIQKLYNLSERQVCDVLERDILVRYFAGLGLMDEIPHFTLLGKFKQRIGVHGMEAIFTAILQAADNLGIHFGKIHVIDATHTLASFKHDSDARWGHKSTTKTFFGYKIHLEEDAINELICAVTTTPGNEADINQAQSLLAQSIAHRHKPQVLSADKAYDDGNLREALKSKKIIPAIPVKKNRTHYADVWLLQLKHRAYKQAIRLRKRIERKNRELKEHGLRKTRYQGLLAVSRDAFLVGATLNLKRILKILAGSYGRQGQSPFTFSYVPLTG